MPVTVRVSLEENGTGCIFRHVSGNGERGGEVGEMENGFREEETFKGVKRGLARGGPVPGKVLLGEIKKGSSDVGVVGDKASVEIGKAKERVDIFYLGWGGPTCDSVEFNQVHC